MKKVLYVRHGQSETNLRGVFAGGADDTPLTDLGRDQAKQAGAELKNKSIDHIIASPLSRTLETAQIIASQIGFDPKKIQIDPRLKEYDVGSGNGMKAEGMTAAEMVALPGAEDPGAAAGRIKSALLDIDKQQGTTLIVAHGGVGRIIECLRTNQDPAGFYDLPGYPNAHAVELDLSWLT